MLLCQILLILIILIMFGMTEKHVLFEVNSSFLDVSEQFSFHVSNISDCLKLNRPGFCHCLLSRLMNFIASIMGQNTCVLMFWISMQGQTLFQSATFSL